jgi:UDP-4-amino-4,6-dideoxy-N-acetyl-beta-L-altrosamine transaminase
VAEIPYSRQWIEQDDIDAVDAVMRSNRITQGPKIEEFERALAKSCGAAGAVAVSNGTAALHLACLAAGVGPGWEVITSPISFVASANCALYCGARPAFVDIEPSAYTLDPDRLEDYLRRAFSASPSTRRVILPVHFAGHPCRMVEMQTIAARYGAIVIEDAAHALGARWRDTTGDWHKIGSGSHGRLTTLSFHPVKHITTGEGGAVLSNDADLLERIRMLRSHGITHDPDRIARGQGPWYYEMQSLGYNYRITDMQCALGLQQLARLDRIVARRREIAHRYTAALRDCDTVALPSEHNGAESSFHLYVLQIKLDLVGRTKQEIVEELAKREIRTQVHYIPIHLQPYYRKQFGFKEGDFPVAEEYYRRALSIPLYPAMTDGQVSHVIESVRTVLTN